MKVQNPFDRFKDKSFIPRSAFPASKMLRTSLPLGRVVPVYENAMNPGDHIKIKISELCRFMEMARPVMQNYKVTFGAFYVPYVAFDRFFHNHKGLAPEMAISSDDGARYRGLKQFSLNARDFFNSAMADSEKVHPIMVDAIDLYGMPNLEGSLIDHLEYRIFNEKHLSFRRAENSNGKFINNISPLDVINDPNLNDIFDGSFSPQDDSGYIYLTPSDGGSIQKLPLPIYYFIYFALKYKGLYDPTLEITDTEGWHDFASFLIEPFESTIETIGQVVYTLYGVSFNGNTYTNGNSFDLFGMSADKLMIKYASVLNTVNLNSYRGFTANSISYLAYMSIYSDWFLPETFVDCDDFRADVASGYLNYAVNNATIRLKDVLNNDWINNGPNRNRCMDFFVPYLKNFECLPVLKSLDTITGARRFQQMDGQLTPMANTVEENFGQRMLAKFRDLVNRIGLDYRDNAEAVFGKRPDDATLLRTQVIGFREFDVMIGDVQQTSSTDENGQIGSFGGYAISRDSMKPFEWTAQEHGLVMVVCYVRPQFYAYGTIIDRSKLKSNFMDYLIPSFGGVGMQPITMKQIDGNGNVAHDSSVFGWQERYFEYMHLDNAVTGQMRTIYKDWHSDLLDFDVADSLVNGDITPLYWTEKDQLNRVFVDTTNDPVLMSVYFDGSVTRALPRNIRTDF